jgi:ATP-dependent Clp endopeptidase proteolytic subunit ClpP
MPQDWLKIENKSDGVGEIFIYGNIVDEKWLEADVTPTWIKDQLAKLNNVKLINLFINSAGGSVIAGLAIYSMLKRLSAEVVGYVDGIAASIASHVLMAADKIIIPKNGIIMIHEPHGTAKGKASDFRKAADFYDRAKLAIAAAYVEKTKKTEKEIVEMMDAETVMNGEQAVKLGFADVLDDKKDIKACLTDKTLIINGLEVDIKKFASFPKDRLTLAPANSGSGRLIDARKRFLQL